MMMHQHYTTKSLTLFLNHCVNHSGVINSHGMCKCSQVYNPCPALYFTDVALAELEKEKSLSFIKAWEESEKSKAENK
jgi:hypothetical protein